MAKGVGLLGRGRGDGTRLAAGLHPCRGEASAQPCRLCLRPHVDRCCSSLWNAFKPSFSCSSGSASTTPRTCARGPHATKGVRSPRNQLASQHSGYVPAQLAAPGAGRASQALAMPLPAHRACHTPGPPPCQGVAFAQARCSMAKGTRAGTGPAARSHLWNVVHEHVFDAAFEGDRRGWAAAAGRGSKVGGCRVGRRLPGKGRPSGQACTGPLAHGNG